MHNHNPWDPKIYTDSSADAENLAVNQMIVGARNPLRDDCRSLLK